VSAHRCSSPAAARKEAPCGHGQRAGVHEGRRRRSKRVASPPRWHLLVRRAIPRSIPRNLQLKVQTALWWDLHRISAYRRAAGNAIPQPSHKHPTIDPAKTLYSIRWGSFVITTWMRTVSARPAHRARGQLRDPPGGTPPPRAAETAADRRATPAAAAVDCACSGRGVPERRSPRPLLPRPRPAPRRHGLGTPS